MKKPKSIGLKEPAPWRESSNNLDRRKTPRETTRRASHTSMTSSLWTLELLPSVALTRLGQPNANLAENALDQNLFFEPEVLLAAWPRLLETATKAQEPLKIGKYSFSSRLMVGTGKYRDLAETKEAIETSGAQVVTRRHSPSGFESEWRKFARCHYPRKIHDFAKHRRLLQRERRCANSYAGA